jgi:DNA-directed RNA polymerase subunit RPC12/RpoP
MRNRKIWNSKTHNNITDNIIDGDESMPHGVSEDDLENICANCKNPHGNHMVLKNLNHKVYEIITCRHCGYEIIRLKPEKEFSNKLDVFHKI